MFLCQISATGSCCVLLQINGRRFLFCLTLRSQAVRSIELLWNVCGMTSACPFCCCCCFCVSPCGTQCLSLTWSQVFLMLFARRQSHASHWTVSVFYELFLNWEHLDAEKLWIPHCLTQRRVQLKQRAHVHLLSVEGARLHSFHLFSKWPCLRGVEVNAAIVSLRTQSRLCVMVKPADTQHDILTFSHGRAAAFTCHRTKFKKKKNAVLILRFLFKRQYPLIRQLAHTCSLLILDCHWFLVCAEIEWTCLQRCGPISVLGSKHMQVVLLLQTNSSVSKWACSLTVWVLWACSLNGRTQVWPVCQELVFISVCVNVFHVLNNPR